MTDKLNSAISSALVELEFWTKSHINNSNISNYEIMWDIQKAFLTILLEKGKIEKFPIDLKLKKSQQIIRDLIRDAADELHEARLTLKNSKSHRESEEQDFDLEHFVEEIVDCIKFCLGALIFAGVTPEKFMSIFLKKSLINIKRQMSGY